MASSSSSGAAPPRPDMVTLDMLVAAAKTKALFPMIPRPEYGTAGRQVKVRTNLFIIDFGDLPSKCDLYVRKRLGEERMIYQSLCMTSTSCT